MLNTFKWLSFLMFLIQGFVAYASIAYNNLLLIVVFGLGSLFSLLCSITLAFYREWFSKTEMGREMVFQRSLR